MYLVLKEKENFHEKKLWIHWFSVVYCSSDPTTNSETKDILSCPLPVPKYFEPFQKFDCIWCLFQNFCASPKTNFTECKSSFVNKFLVRHKRFGPAQKILGLVKGQGINFTKSEQILCFIFYSFVYRCFSDHSEFIVSELVIGSCEQDKYRTSALFFYL